MLWANGLWSDGLWTPGLWATDASAPPPPPPSPAPQPEGGWNFARDPQLAFIEQQNHIAMARVIAFITSGSMQ